MDMEKKDVFSEMAKKWPSTIVARSEISKFTGGLFSPGRMRNLDSQGKGPKIRIRSGRKIAYDVDSLVEWLRDYCSVIQET